MNIVSLLIRTTLSLIFGSIVGVTGAIVESAYPEGEEYIIPSMIIVCLCWGFYFSVFLHRKFPLEIREEIL